MEQGVTAIKINRAFYFVGCRHDYFLLEERRSGFLVASEGKPTNKKRMFFTRPEQASDTFHSHILLSGMLY